MAKTEKQLDTEDQQSQEASGQKDASPPLTPEAHKKEVLTIMDDIIRAYKKLIGVDEPETEKLIREMTKCFVTAGAVIRKLNRRK